MKRNFYFLATNIAIMLALSVTMRILSVEPYLNANGLDLKNLLAFATIMGFGGAFISLAISKWSAKRMSGAVVIEEAKTSTEIWLIKTVRTQADMVGITMPESLLVTMVLNKAFNSVKCQNYI